MWWPSPTGPGTTRAPAGECRRGVRACAGVRGRSLVVPRDPPHASVAPHHLQPQPACCTRGLRPPAANLRVYPPHTLHTPPDTPQPSSPFRKCKEVRCKNMNFRDGYGQNLDRSSVCFDEGASVTVMVTDTCPCHCE
jgi:hypothetical protein